MTREIVLVTLIDAEDINLEYTKAFSDSKKANEYFVKVLKEKFPEDCKEWSQEDFDDCLNDGYYADTTHYCLYINEITLEDDMLNLC